MSVVICAEINTVLIFYIFWPHFEFRVYIHSKLGQKSQNKNMRNSRGKLVGHIRHPEIEDPIEIEDLIEIENPIGQVLSSHGVNVVCCRRSLSRLQKSRYKRD